MFRWVRFRHTPFISSRRFAHVRSGETVLPNERFYETYRNSTEAFRSGHLEESVSLNNQALSIAAECSELNWKDVAAVHLNQAHLLKLLGKLDEAKTHAEQALKALDAHFSANKPEVGHALDVLGELCTELGETSAANEYIARTLEVKGRIYGAHGFELAKSYNIRGAINLRENNLKQSRSDFIRALGINVRHLGRAHPLPLPVGITLSNIAGVLRKEANDSWLVECISIYRAVVESFEAIDSDSWMLGSAITDLAECLIERKSSQQEVKLLLTRSLTIFISSRGIDHPSTMRAAALLKECSDLSSDQNPNSSSTDAEFVNTLLTECESIVPGKEGRVSGDIIFLDRRGHVGFGHPHTPLV